MRDLSLTGIAIRWAIEPETRSNWSVHVLRLPGQGNSSQMASPPQGSDSLVILFQDTDSGGSSKATPSGTRNPERTEIVSPLGLGCSVRYTGGCVHYLREDGTEYKEEDQARIALDC